MSSMYMVATGGTGGHVFPALALARELVNRGDRVTFLVDRRGQRYLPEDMPHREIAAASPSGTMIHRLRAVLSLARGFFQSLRAIGELRPQAIACFGGYASVPAALAARLRSVPVMVHEQNAVFGRANRNIGGFAGVIALTFADTDALPSGNARRVVTGNPVRPGFVRSAATRTGTSGDSLNVLVIGGSQGARILSDIVPAAMLALPDTIRQRLKVVQQCRPEDIARVREAYADCGFEVELASFFDDMVRRMSDASLVISRSGASSISEILALSRPSVLIPYLHAADGHQQANAERLERAGAAILHRQDEVTAEALSASLAAVLGDAQRREAMSRAAESLDCPDAAATLADAMVSISTGGRP
ncbi:MAG: undecaprenyldiphospho-muramoylpentapeptide beta-N-acetylglucosaminyltransferase [Geminicoccaceae bacterium]|nr:undecaprenyldiphospho-muramoylpentapeptide beta-N-acetylglucosaminyltransferase [Geminicoccaceae bacterium]